jgi:pilus assembly protein Flp/PilA
MWPKCARVPDGKAAEVTMIYAPDKEGQGLVEYALILMLIAIVVVAIVAIFGTQVSTMFSEVSSMIP